MKDSLCESGSGIACAKIEQLRLSYRFIYNQCSIEQKVIHQDRMGRRGDHTREELEVMILEAAERIVEEEGMAGLTMRKIASAIGYTVGSLYLIYKNQDQLIMAVNAQTIDAMRKRLGEAIQGDMKPEQAVQALATAYIDYAQNNIHRWHMAFEHRLPEGESTPQWISNRVEEMFTDVMVILGQILPHMDETMLRATFLGYWSMVHGLCSLALTGRLDWDDDNEVNVELLAKFAITGYFNGFKPS